MPDKVHTLEELRGRVLLAARDELDDVVDALDMSFGAILDHFKAVGLPPHLAAPLQSHDALHQRLRLVSGLLADLERELGVAVQDVDNAAEALLTPLNLAKVRERFAAAIAGRAVVVEASDDVELF